MALPKLDKPEAIEAKKPPPPPPLCFGSFGAILFDRSSTTTTREAIKERETLIQIEISIKLGDMGV